MSWKSPPVGPCKRNISQEADRSRPQSTKPALRQGGCAAMGPRKSACSIPGAFHPRVIPGFNSFELLGTFQRREQRHSRCTHATAATPVSAGERERERERESERGRMCININPYNGGMGPAFCRHAKTGKLNHSTIWFQQSKHSIISCSLLQ